MSIGVIGLNHKTAPLEIREKVSLSRPQIIQISKRIELLPSVLGCAILSTCNRTEFYFSAVNLEKAIIEISEVISEKSSMSIGMISPYFYIKKTREAVHHLFAVAAGLDSMILGETQIQGQVQDAYEIALDTHISDNIINTLFMNALSVGKRVRTETQIDRETVSISSSAVSLAKNFFGSLEDKSVLVLGAGETSELTSRHLISNGIKNILVANRTYERAKRLAEDILGEAIKFDDLNKYLESADIIISSTASPKYLLTKEKLGDYLTSRTKPLLLIDIAVPRDIDPKLAQYKCVTIYDIDDLKNVVASNLKKRQEEAKIAEKIVDEELENFFFWLDSLTVVPTIIKLREQINKIKESEIIKAKNRLENITPRESIIIEKLANSIVNQWLHQPIINMKLLAGNHRDEIECYLRAINELWSLEEGKYNEKNH